MKLVRILGRRHPYLCSAGFHKFHANTNEFGQAARVSRPLLEEIELPVLLQAEILQVPPNGMWTPLLWHHCVRTPLTMLRPSA